MVAFYNEADNLLYKQPNSQFITQERFRGDVAPNPEEIEPAGLIATDVYDNYNTNNNYSGSNYGGTGGNAFGYGSQIEPGGSFGSYDSINYTGGLPGDVQQYGVGRQFEDPSASPTGETYSYKKEVPGWMRMAAAFVPGGNFGLNFLENKMNANRDQPPGNYRIGGLDENMKGLYDNLAGNNMLFDGPGGVKTLTGKNFTGKGYLEGQIDIYNDKFAGMTEEDIEELKNDPRQRFKYKQYLESSQMYKTNKAKEENVKKTAALAAAASRRESERQYNPAVHGATNYGLDKSGKQSYSGDAVGAPGLGFGIGSDGGPVSNKTGKGRTGYMYGGRIGYFFGGLAARGMKR